MRGVTAHRVAMSGYEDDAIIAPVIRQLLAAMDGADWRLDQDFGSG
jgi:hypothetical protein